MDRSTKNIVADDSSFIHADFLSNFNKSLNAERSFPRDKLAIKIFKPKIFESFKFTENYDIFSNQVKSIK